MAQTAGVTSWLAIPIQTNALDPIISSTNEASLILDADTIYWEGPSWSTCRYGTSSLSSNSKPPTPASPASYPSWMEGYFAINYKFTGASFPQGRRVLSLRTAGAGLGTCLSIPNVGYNPKSAHALRFLKDNGDGKVYEDLAYTIPRKFESFWPEAKVLSVQTNGGSTGNNLTPKCYVTGDGCTQDVNPTLHQPSSRVAFDFDGPTRRGGRRFQSTDVTLLSSSEEVVSNNNNDVYVTAKSYSEYNTNQELQTFFKEVSSYMLTRDDEEVSGKIRVAAFLPSYIKQMEGSTAASGIDYNENEAVAVYDYAFVMKKIDEADAASL